MNELYQAFEEEEIPDRAIWEPEPELKEDPLVLLEALKALPETSTVLPSQFTEYAFYMPDISTGGYSNFSFKGREHMRRIYDTPAKRVLLTCARQVEKSTLLGNIALCYTCMIPSYQVLYVSPSATQTTTFSNDRIKEPIETSSVLKKFTTQMLSQNILVKQFVNRSKITLRYAFLNADRTRGIPAWLLEIDEFQDILTDNLPVVEQCLSHAPEKWKRYIYAGTPKSLDNNLEYLRSRYSTQGEWVVPCDHHTPRYWNILGEKNIGKRGLVCEKCHNLINSQHADAQWAAMVEDAPYENYRIPQLMVPWKSWDEIILNYEHYSRDKFYNEVLGISYDSGLRPLTLQQVKACCNPDIHIADYESYRNLSFSQPIYAGVDWGTGENSYTVLVLATYLSMKFRVFYVHRFIGQEVDPPVQLEMIDELIRFFNVKLIGTDYGGGFDRNDHLIRQFGPQRVWKYQYMVRTKRKLEWDAKLGRFKTHRTEVMSDIFNAIKRANQCEFPRWEDFKDPYATDMTNIFSEYNETLHMTQYKHSIDKPDDAFHAFLYAWIVSMIDRPRPDIITPRKIDPRTGAETPRYTGPLYQG
jgi:Phage terminase large subunit gpA, ATPase domain